MYTSATTKSTQIYIQNPLTNISTFSSLPVTITTPRKLSHSASSSKYDTYVPLTPLINVLTFYQHIVVRLNTIKVGQIPCQLPRQQAQGTRLPLSKDSLDGTEGSSNLLGQEAETDCDRISFSPKGDKRFLPLTNAQLLQICFNCFFLIWLYD